MASSTIGSAIVQITADLSGLEEQLFTAQARVASAATGISARLSAIKGPVVSSTGLSSVISQLGRYKNELTGLYNEVRRLDALMASPVPVPGGAGIRAARGVTSQAVPYLGQIAAVRSSSRALGSQVSSVDDQITVASASAIKDALQKRLNVMGDAARAIRNKDAQEWSAYISTVENAINRGLASPFTAIESKMRLVREQFKAIQKQAVELGSASFWSPMISDYMKPLYAKLEETNRLYSALGGRTLKEINKAETAIVPGSGIKGRSDTTLRIGSAIADEKFGYWHTRAANVYLEEMGMVENSLSKITSTIERERARQIVAEKAYNDEARLLMAERDAYWYAQAQKARFANREADLARINRAERAEIEGMYEEDTTRIGKADVGKSWQELQLAKEQERQTQMVSMWEESRQKALNIEKNSAAEMEKVRATLFQNDEKGWEEYVAKRKAGESQLSDSAKDFARKRTEYTRQWEQFAIDSEKRVVISAKQAQDSISGMASTEMAMRGISTRQTGTAGMTGMSASAMLAMVQYPVRSYTLPGGRTISDMSADMLQLYRTTSMAAGEAARLSANYRHAVDVKVDPIKDRIESTGREYAALRAKVEALYATEIAMAERLGATLQELNAIRKSQAKSLSQMDAARGREITAIEAKTPMTGFQRLLGRMGRSVASFVAISLVVEAQQALSKLIETAIQYNETIENVKIGVSALVMAQADLAENGRVLQGTEAINASLQLSDEIIKKLQYDNMQTIATFDQLAKAFQSALSPGLAAGFNLEQIRQFTLSMVQAASAMQLPLDMMAEELRSMLRGTITPRATIIATNLGITNEQIRALKGDAQGLFNFIMGKLDAFSKYGRILQDSYAGAKSNLEDAFKMAAGQASVPFFEYLKELFKSITKELVVMDEKTRTLVVRPEVLASFRDFYSIVAMISSAFVGMSRVLLGIGGLIAKPIAAVYEWANGLTTASAKTEYIAKKLKEIDETRKSMAKQNVDTDYSGSTLGYDITGISGSVDAHGGLVPVAQPEQDTSELLKYYSQLQEQRRSIVAAMDKAMSGDRQGIADYVGQLYDLDVQIGKVEQQFISADDAAKDFAMDMMFAGLGLGQISAMARTAKLSFDGLVDAMRNIKGVKLGSWVSEDLDSTIDELENELKLVEGGMNRARGNMIYRAGKTFTEAKKLYDEAIVSGSEDAIATTEKKFYQVQRADQLRLKIYDADQANRDAKKGGGYKAPLDTETMASKLASYQKAVQDMYMELYSFASENAQTTLKMQGRAYEADVANFEISAQQKRLAFSQQVADMETEYKKLAADIKKAEGQKKAVDPAILEELAERKTMIDQTKEAQSQHNEQVEIWLKLSKQAITSDLDRLSTLYGYYKDLATSTKERVYWENQLSQIEADKIKRQYPGDTALVAAAEEKSRMEQERNLALSGDNFFAGFMTGVEDYKREMSGAGRLGADVFENLTSAIDSAADSLANFASTGKFDFADFATSILNDVNKMIIKFLLMKTIMSLFPTKEKSFTQLGTGLFETNIGTGTFEASSGVDDFITAWKKENKFHSGGLSEDEVVAVLQRGEYVMTKDQMAKYGDLIEAIPKYHSGGLVDDYLGIPSSVAMNEFPGFAAGVADFLTPKPLSASQKFLEAIESGYKNRDPFAHWGPFSSMVMEADFPLESIAGKLGTVADKLGDAISMGGLAISRGRIARTAVVDELGNPKRVYRGTTQVYGEESPKEWDIDALYGPGAYFTEGKINKEGLEEITSGYAQTYEYQDILQKQKWLEDHYDKRRGPSGDLQSHFQTTYEKSKSRLEYDLERLGAPNVRPAYLDIDNPLDLDASVSEDFYNNVRERLRDFYIERNGLDGLEDKMVDFQLSDIKTNADLWRSFSNHPAFGGSARDFNNWILDQGNDALTHMGGGGQHRVWIALNENDIYSYIDDSLDSVFKESAEGLSQGISIKTKQRGKIALGAGAGLAGYATLEDSISQATESLDSLSEQSSDLQSTYEDMNSTISNMQTNTESLSSSLSQASSSSKGFGDSLLQSAMSMATGVSSLFSSGGTSNAGNWMSILSGVWSIFGGLGKSSSSSATLASGISTDVTSGNYMNFVKKFHDGIGNLYSQVPSHIFHGAPKLHDGLAYDEFPAILQDGETVIPKNFRGNEFGNYSESDNSTNIGSNITVNVTNNGNGSGNQQSEVDQKAFGRMIARTIEEEFNRNLRKQMRPGGTLNSTMR